MSRQATVLIFASAFVAFAAYAQVITQRITLPRSDGVVVDLGSNAKTSWLPSREDVVLFEKILPKAVATNKCVQSTRIGRELPNYKRQYYGVVRNGQRELHATLFHNSSEAVREGRWLKSFLQIMGGGDNFGRVTFELRSRRVTELFPNGPK